MSRKQFLWIVSAFWLYVALSNILYAYAMEIALSESARQTLFAPWHVRLLQHVFLYPVVVVCLNLALRVGWQPLWRALPLQLLFALVVSLLARPALQFAQVLVKVLYLRGTGNDEMLRHWQAQGGNWFERYFGDVSLAGWFASATSFLVAYGFGLAILMGFDMYRRLRDREIQVRALESQWASARLDALKNQLSPHTLFNLLHTLRGQISWDPAAAQKMVVQLADLLRRLLSAGERDFVSLREELQFVTLYLQLQQQRFSDRLRVRLPAIESLPVARVPSLILQPLVENAVSHGLEGHEGPVTVAIDAVIEGGLLTITVDNEMALRSDSAPVGVGLRNVRERLAVQYGDRAPLEAGPVGDDHWRVRLVLPLES